MRQISSPTAAPATEGKSTRRIFFAAARRLVDAVKGNKEGGMMIPAGPFRNRA